MEQIGHGGMGLVYRARQLSPNRDVALKIVAPYSLRATEAKQRFLMEIEAMAAVEHPSVLPLYEAGEDEAGRPWLTMQLMEGGTLADTCTSYSGKWREAAKLIQNLCHAIAFAHERGIIHRDLKPSNILFNSQGHPHIADFGLAKWAHTDSGVTQSSYLLGSPSYLAPEAATKGSKATTTISDVYGLGAIFYELLTGAKPYDGDSAAEILTQIINQPPAPPRKLTAKLPRDLEVIVLKAMARDPAKRYHSANALSNDIDRWLEGRPIQARPVSALERTIAWARRNPALSTVSVLLIASLITAGILQWRANRDLTIALNDAEDRVDFMTRELPDAIEPLGRLDVLDSVFLDVSEHFEENPRKDPETLARHADFLGRWAQILRPRGLTIEAVQRLRKSHQKALAATKGNQNPSLPIIRSRVSSGLNLGEALLEEGSIDEAREILDDTKLYAETFTKFHPHDIELKLRRAEISMEIVIADLKKDNPDSALETSKECRQQWAEIKNILLADPSLKNQSSLADAARYFYFEAGIFAQIEDPESQMQSLRMFQTEADELRKRFPENLHFRSESVVARTHLANGYHDTGIGDPDEIRTLLEEADREGAILAATDPSNIRWANDNVYTAFAFAQIARKKQDAEDFTKWHTKVAERILPLYQTYTTDLTFLKAQRKASVYSIERPLSHDWELERPHYLGVVQIQKEIATLQTATKPILNLARLLERSAWQISQNDSKDEAATFLSELIEKLKNNPGRNAKERHLWNWVRAFTYRRLASYQSNGEEAQTRSHEILLTSTPAIRALFHAPTAQSHRPLRLLKNLLKAGASDAPRKDNDEWTTLILELTPLLEEHEQDSISELIIERLPETDPRYQSLKPLIKP